MLNPDNGRCQCSNTSYLNSKGLCIECGALKFYDLRLEKCFCKKQYFKTEEGECIDCPPKSLYQDGKCQCVFNYYLSNGKCIKCQKTENNINCNRVELQEL